MKTILFITALITLIACKKQELKQQVTSKQKEYVVCIKSQNFDFEKDTVYLWRNSQQINPFTNIVKPGDTLIFYYSTQKYKPILLILLRHDTLYKQEYYPDPLTLNTKQKFVVPLL